MPRFGQSRLYRPDVNELERLYFRLFGLADPAHFVRSRYFTKLIAGLEPGSVLDAGCGRGDYSFYMAERWPHARITAVDVDSSLIARNVDVLQKMALRNLQFSVQDLSVIDTAEGYDLIVCVDALEHIANQELVLANFFKALKPGGAVFIHMPLVRPRPVPFDKYIQDFHEWSEHEHIAPMRTMDEFLGMLRSAGFSTEKWQYTFDYSTGELACSLFSLFHEDTKANRLAQGFLSPFTRLLAYVELSKVRPNGFAAAVLGIKKK